MSTESNTEQKIKALGQEIFSDIGEAQPKIFDKNFVNAKLMQWSFDKKDFKNSLFRLVDVLPALKTKSAISRHILEYLKPSLEQLSKPLSYVLDTLRLGVVPETVASFTVKQSINQMASMFIAGESAKEAFPKLDDLLNNGMTYTVDLLGEYAVSNLEGEKYLNRYLEALELLGKEQSNWNPNWQVADGHPGTQKLVNVSVKLSALYPHTNVLNFTHSVAELSKKIGLILELAQKHNAHVYFDAEDTAHNPIIYATFKEVFGKLYPDFPLPGIVIQAYAKDAEKTVNDILNFAKEQRKKVAIRLVKGAYWDSETASSAQNYWENPLFIDKAETDLNFEKLSRLLLDNIDHCYPAFGSHNIRSLSQACIYAEENNIPKDKFELQMLYGMAAPIATAFTKRKYLVRMYVPLGELIPGMGYLVRRLLENTSNDSFLRHTFYEETQIDRLLEKPVSKNDNE